MSIEERKHYRHLRDVYVKANDLSSLAPDSLELKDQLMTAEIMLDVFQQVMVEKYELHPLTPTPMVRKLTLKEKILTRDIRQSQLDKLKFWKNNKKKK